jgi:hypothetical protein
VTLKLGAAPDDVANNFVCVRLDDDLGGAVGLLANG